MDDISRKVFYARVPENKFIETAYARYWREIQNLSQEFDINQSKQKFVLPKELYEKMQRLIDKINKAREVAKHLTPDGNNVYPDTEGLKPIIKEINSLYVDFVHTARNYLGVDKLKPFSMRQERILGIEEAEEKKKS